MPLAVAPKKLSLPQLPRLIHEHPYETAPEAPIPFDWTGSSKKTWCTCHRLFYWKYIMRISPRAKGAALAIGSAFHAALGEWYQSTKPMDKIVDHHVDEIREEAKSLEQYYDEDDFEKLVQGIESLKGMLLGYADAYEQERKGIASRKPLVEVQFRVHLGDFDFIGKIDLIFQEKKGDMAIEEHKTASRIQDGYIDRLPLDTQVRGYVLGAREGLKDPRGKLVRKVIYDVVRKTQLRRKSNESMGDYALRIAEDYLSRPSWYFYREPLLFSIGDLDCLKHELRQVNREYLAIATLPGAANNPRAWLPNDAACNQYGKTCSYFHLCTQGFDKGTGRMFTQKESLHEELEDD